MGQGRPAGGARGEGGGTGLKNGVSLGPEPCFLQGLHPGCETSSVAAGSVCHRLSLATAGEAGSHMLAGVTSWDLRSLAK